MGISFLTYTKSIGPVSIDAANFNADEISNNKLYMPEADAASKASD